MDEASVTEELEDLPILPDDVPVVMPELPLSLNINTIQQFKAISDPMRLRILSIIRHQPATAKQLADRLGATPGAIGHHLHVLEAAGLAQVVARRITRGIIAKYYTRAARIFNYDMPEELLDGTSVSLQILSSARDELAEAVISYGEEACLRDGFPHARISPTRAEIYSLRLEELLTDFLQEPVDPDGEVFAMSLAIFKAPAWQAPIKDKDEG